MGEIFNRLKKIKGLPYAFIGIVAGIALLLAAAVALGVMLWRRKK